MPASEDTRFAEIAHRTSHILAGGGRPGFRTPKVARCDHAGVEMRTRFLSGQGWERAVAPSVLIADPDPAIRAVLRIVLTRRGYRTRTAATAAEALAALDDAPEAVVTELVFPDRRGLDLVRAVRASRPDTVILVLTEINADSSAIEALAAGAHDYIRKPFSPDELVARLERHGTPR